MNSQANNQDHVSVLLEEVIEGFSDLEIHTFFEGTLGAGGHAESILAAHEEIKTYIGCDQDQDALAIAKERLEGWAPKIRYIHSNFAPIGEILKQCELEKVDGFFLT